MRILLIDNYDSYTHNIVNTLAPLHSGPLHLIKNDEVTPAIANTYDKVIISPGPDLPLASGNIITVIRELNQHIALLGICLGHQAIAEAYGASLYRVTPPLHGTATQLIHTLPSPLFANISNEARFGLYHSWAVNAASLPNELAVTSIATNGIVMSCAHKYKPIYSVQFHPESYLSTHGAQLIHNWLSL